MSDDKTQPANDELPEQRRPYQRPAVVWREPYEPTGFGVSCAKQPGNPGCNTGPFSS